MEEREEGMEDEEGERVKVGEADEEEAEREEVPSDAELERVSELLGEEGVFF